MLLTLTTTHSPATDIGFLPRKNPARLQSFSLTFGKAHVFYPEATPERCTVALLVEVDPIGLVRNRRGPAGVTHRLSIEIVPGVFGGEILGTYMPRTGLVSVYAFVYALRNLPLPRMLCEFYLRLHALKTFVHEVAHHHDQVARIARGRWRSDRRPTFAAKRRRLFALRCIFRRAGKPLPAEDATKAK